MFVHTSLAKHVSTLYRFKPFELPYSMYLPIRAVMANMSAIKWQSSAPGTASAEASKVTRRSNTKP
jgi:hypothetical protein